MSESSQAKEENDDWNGEKRVWGETFTLTHQTEGNEAVAEVPHTHADGAIDQFVRSDETAFWPGDAPDSPEEVKTEDLAVAVWEGEQASAKLTLATSDRDILDEWEPLTRRVEEALPDEWELAERGLLE